MPLRVLNSDGEGNIFALAEAIEFAVDNGAHVINLSLGLDNDSDLLEDTIKWATKRGVFVVGAAGNNNSASEHYPAASSCTVSVTGIDENEVKVDTANYGDWVHLAVPSKSIYSTFPPSGYAWWTGTSMATPFVAGQGALLLAEDRLLTPREILFLIYGTAESVDSSNPGLVGMLGAGLPQLHDSLVQLQTGTIPDVSGGIMPGSCIIEPPAITPSVNVDDVRLTWQPNGGGVQSYAVYRSGEAYFGVNAGTLLTSTIPAHRGNYTDKNILTGTSMYFYLMQGIGEGLVPSKESNRVGVFQFAIVGN
jgi:subtilisin family serine protease